MRFLACPVLALLFACAGAAYQPGHPVAHSGASNAHDEGRFEGKGGTSLFWQSWRPRGDVKAALVIVHGLKDHSSRYGFAATQLAASGVAVYAFDLRGHGDSAGDRVVVDKFDDYLDDLGAFLLRVRAAEPGKPVFLFGHSMGGTIAALFALDRKPDLRGLILSAPALQADVGGIKRGSTRALAAVAPNLAVFSLDVDQFSRDPLTVATIKADRLVDQGNAPAHTAVELLDAMDRVQAKESELALPLLVLHGDADQITMPEASKTLVAKAASTDKTLKLYPGLWHDLLHEPERAQVLADVQGWIEARTR